MAGAVGNYSDGETIHGGDLNADLTSLLGNDARLFLDIFAGWNILVSGFALTAGAGMAVNVASGLAYANGVRLNMVAGGVTLGTGNTQPRYDVIWVQAGKTAGTNPTTSNPTQSDSGAFGVQAGTPGSSPVVPAMGDPTKVQIGTVYVPANATGIGSCTLNSQATAPNAQGPIKTFIDLLTHIAASILTTPVHGVQATAAGGLGANMLAQTNASGRVYAATYADHGVDGGGDTYSFGTPGATTPNVAAITNGNGNVGSAIYLWDGANFRQLHPYNDGSHVPGEIPQYNASGRVEDSERLQGYVTGVGQNNIPLLDANGAVAKAEALVNGAGTAHKFTGGVTASFTAANNTETAFSATLDDSSFTPGHAIACQFSGGGNAMPCRVSGVAAGTVSGYIYNGGGAQTVQVTVMAWN